MIKIKQLNKTYFNKAHTFSALNNVSLTVKEGEIFGVIGRSGAGKSTLIRCINLLEQPTTGHVIIDGIDITSLSSEKLRQLRKQLGMIFQNFNLLESRTVYENIALPLELLKYSKKRIDKTIAKLIKLVGLEERQNYYPFQLSGGQKQRVAIARALATNPKILLSDEATSALDPESTASILRLLKKINRELGVTILLITHEMEVIKTICDNVAVLEAGELLEQGSVIDVFTKPETETTKALTQKTLHLDLPEPLKSKINSKQKSGLHPVVRLAFVGENSNAPIIATLLHRFRVTANILQADLEWIKNSSVGFTVCQFLGEESAIQEAIIYLENLNIKVEVIGYV